MTKTIKELKSQCETLNNKLQELTEEELKSIVGAKGEYTILPNDYNIWRTYNPTLFNLNRQKDNLGLLNNDAKNEVVFKDVVFNGSISNREDE